MVNIANKNKKKRKMKKNISTTITEIENDIDIMSKSKNIKDIVNKYNNIIKSIDKCRTKLDKQLKSIENDKEVNLISDTEFVDKMAILEQENIENDLEIEQMKKKVKRINKLALECINYLDKQKMEITSVD